MKFYVEVQRTIVTTVEVSADSPEAAAKQVNQRDFQLPDRDAWEGLKDWHYVVTSENGGEELYDGDGRDGS